MKRSTEGPVGDYESTPTASLCHLVTPEKNQMIVLTLLPAECARVEHRMIVSVALDHRNKKSIS